MKNIRQKTIIDIIEKFDVETQEELIERLSDVGFNVTQATVSRDIRELKLIKTASINGKYKYTFPDKNDEEHDIYNFAFISSVKTVENAMNIVVIKTYPGMANAVAAGIDTMSKLGIVGCVAGDDTIFAVTHSIDEAKTVVNRIKDIANGDKIAKSE